MNEYLIYKATNLVNGKTYVGRNKGAVLTRKFSHEHLARYGKGYHFHHALKKYGPELFEWTILERASSKEEADELECLWIERLSSWSWLNGYNIAPGGRGGITEEMSRKGQINNPQRVEVIDEDGNIYLSIEKASKQTGISKVSIQKMINGKIHHAGGKRFARLSEGVPEKYDRQKHKPRPHRKQKTILDSNGIVYSSIQEAARALRLNPSLICAVLKGKRKSTGGFSFQYKEKLCQAQ